MSDGDSGFLGVVIFAVGITAVTLLAIWAQAAMQRYEDRQANRRRQAKR